MFTALRTENVKADTSTITLDKHGGTGGTDTVDASLPDITPPTREGYTFNGYSYRKPGANLLDTSSYVLWTDLTEEDIKDSSVPDGTARKFTKVGDSYKKFRLHHMGPAYIKKGDEFTVSVWMKASKKVDMGGTPFNCELFSSTKKVKYPDLTTEWQQYVITGTASKDVRDNKEWEAVVFYFDNNQFSKGDSLYISSLKVEYGDTATDYSKPDSSNALVKVYDANGKSTGQTVPEGATLYADWKAHTYTINFDANGGTGTMNSMTKPYDKYIIPPKCTFTNGDYVFKGWNSKADGTGTDYPLTVTHGMSIPNIATEDGATATLYAQWGLPNKKEAEEGYYHLLGYYNEVLEADASSVRNEAQKDTKSQIWHITKYGDGYRLTDESDGKCLTAEESSSDTGKVSMQDKSDSDYQKWYFLGLSDGIAVMNAKNNYVLSFGYTNGTIDEHISKSVWTYQNYNASLYQRYHLQKATETVTCEDWFVDKDNNRKVKIASHTKTYDYGATANGSDFGTSNIDSNGNTISGHSYDYKGSTNAIVNENGATVYRYFWAWTNLNLYNSNGDEDYFSSSCSFSIDGKAWVSGIHNEDDSRISTVQPYGTTYYIKDITPPAYEKFDHVSSNMTYDSTNNWYTYTPTYAGTAMEIYMKGNGKGGKFYVNANGGNYSAYANEITNGTSVKVSFLPTRAGYTLEGLYTEASGGTKVVNADGAPANDGTYSKDDKWTLNGAMNVYAHWTPKSYSISYDLNGGVASGNSSSYTIESTSSSLNAPTKTGYTFTGWTGSNGETPQKEVKVPDTDIFTLWKLDIYDYPSATITHIPTEDDIKGLSVKKSYNITDETGSHIKRDDYYIGKMYTWVYSEKEQTITDTLHTDDSGALYVNDALIATNSSAATTSVTYTLNKGWNKIEVLYEEKDGDDYACFGKKLLTDGIVTAMNPSKKLTNLSYTANWIPNTYTVKFDSNGGSGTMDNESMTYDVSKALTPSTFTKTGYSFAGWNTKADGTGTSYSDGAYVKNLTSDNAGTVTLYAQWTPNKYTVTCEDWFVDRDNNRKVKIASHTKDYYYGATADGADFGTKNINSLEEQKTAGSFNIHYPYIYKSSTTAAVTETGATVYRYYWAYTDIDIFGAANRTTQHQGTVSFSTNGNVWVTSVGNEDDSRISTIQPYGTTYYIKDIAAKNSYEEFDHTSSNMTYDSSNGWYTYSPTAAGAVIGIFMKYKTYTITYDLNDSNDSYKATNNPNNNTAYTYADEVNLSEPARPGYFFRGWKDSDGNIVTSISKGSYGDKTFTATWEKIPNLPSSGSRDGLIFTVVSVLGLAVILFRKLKHRT